MNTKADKSRSEARGKKWGRGVDIACTAVFTFPAASVAFSSFLKQNCSERDTESWQDRLGVIGREEKLDRGRATAPMVNETPTKYAIKGVVKIVFSGLSSPTVRNWRMSFMKSQTHVSSRLPDSV